MRRRSLSVKLFVSYVLVVAIASVAAFGVARWLGPRLFDHEVQQIGQRLGWSDTGPPGTGEGPIVTPSGRGRGQGAGQVSPAITESTTGTPSDRAAQQQAAIDDELADAFTDSLSVALLAALGVGSVAALAAAVLVSRRLLSPLDRMRGVVRSMASGDLSATVPEPSDRELAALARDVNALGSALEHTDERRARLVSDLSHELRTPITSLDGFLEGLQDGVFQPDQETLSAMRSETRRLERLAADLGTLSRADEGAFDLEVREVDLGEAATSAARALSGAYAAAGIDLTIDEMHPLPVVADPDRIGQVFTNLLRNALQHTPRGGGVTVSGGADRQAARVWVRDTGAGIARGDLSRIFDRFVRLGPGDGSGGAGIGLTIARGIVAAHEGNLTAHSDGPDRGASFEVSIPLAPRR